MFYVLVVDGEVHENIPEFDPRFPGIHIKDRFSEDVLSQCVQSPVEIEQYWKYEKSTGLFTPPPEPAPILIAATSPEEELSSIQNQMSSLEARKEELEEMISFAVTRSF